MTPAGTVRPSVINSNYQQMKNADSRDPIVMMNMQDMIYSDGKSLNPNVSEFQY